LPKLSTLTTLSTLNTFPFIRGPETSNPNFEKVGSLLGTFAKSRKPEGFPLWTPRRRPPGPWTIPPLVDTKISE
jgi:hypothetical protein